MKSLIASLRKMKGCDPDTGTFIFNVLHILLFVVAGVLGILALMV